MSAQEPLSPEREAQIREYIVGLMKSGASDRMIKESLQQLGIEPSSVLHLIRDAMVESKTAPAQSPAKHGDILRSVQEKKKSARNLMLFGFFLASVGFVLNLAFGNVLTAIFRTVIRGLELSQIPGYLLTVIGSIVFFVGLYRYTTGFNADQN
jgi:hypothetical protein